MFMNNFQPLSLLNNDYKIFAKMLAMCLEKEVPSLIHIDQVGFIAGHLASNEETFSYHVKSYITSASSSFGFMISKPIFMLTKPF